MTVFGETLGIMVST